MRWYGVRSFYRFEASADRPDVYEERVVLFEADGADAAVAKAEAESAQYVALLEHGEVLPCWQAFSLSDEPGEGAEVFSLMRNSALPSGPYIDRFFDTGEERQREID